MSNSEILRRMIASGSAETRLPLLDDLEVCIAPAIAKLGRGMLETDLTVSGVKAERLTQPRLLEALPDPALLTILRADDILRPALLSVTPSLVNALVECQTGGRDSPPLLLDRLPTMVDAALSKPFLEGIITHLRLRLTQMRGAATVPAYRDTGFETVPKSLRDLLAEVDYVALHAHIAFADGQRQGAITLAVPLDDLAQGNSALTATGGWSQQLAENVAAAPLRLNVTLKRFSIPLGRAMALAVGDTLPLPADALSALQLESLDGTHLARGRLGQMNGYRAARILPHDTETGVQMPDMEPPEPPASPPPPLPSQ